MTHERQQVQARLEAVLSNIQSACSRVGRSPEEVQLVAVSKRQPLDRVLACQEAMRSSSFNIVFGENYVQEWKGKVDSLATPCQCHLIGPLQSNKAKDAVRLFDLIQTVHSKKLYNEIAKQATKISKSQDVLLQVNISSDPAKSGFDPRELLEFLKGQDRKDRGIQISGLMAITSFYQDAEQVRSDYRALFALAKESENILISKGYDATPTFHISMGMSADYEIAIEEGATIVRVGTAIFGSRPE